MKLSQDLPILNEARGCKHAEGSGHIWALHTQDHPSMNHSRPKLPSYMFFSSLNTCRIFEISASSSTCRVHTSGLSQFSL